MKIQRMQIAIVLRLAAVVLIAITSTAPANAGAVDANVPPGSYVLSAQSRRYRFPSQSMSIASPLANIEIVAFE
jgi:hypothetical protein